MDIEYRFPFGEGWGELEGIANRSKGPDNSSWDLWQHEQSSGQRLTLFDEEKKQHIRPGVVEPAAEVRGDRLHRVHLGRGPRAPGLRALEHDEAEQFEELCLGPPPTGTPAPGKAGLSRVGGRD